MNVQGIPLYAAAGIYNTWPAFRAFHYSEESYACAFWIGGGGDNPRGPQLLPGADFYWRDAMTGLASATGKVAECVGGTNDAAILLGGNRAVLWSYFGCLLGASSFERFCTMTDRALHGREPTGVVILTDLQILPADPSLWVACDDLAVRGTGRNPYSVVDTLEMGARWEVAWEIYRVLAQLEEAG
jgi:hypothetical protein